MRNKKGFMVIFLMTLLLFTFSSYGQDAMSTVDKLIKAAQEKQELARTKYTTAFEENKPQPEQDKLKAEWQKATEDVRDLRNVRAELEKKSSETKNPPVKNPPPTTGPGSGNQTGNDTGAVN